MNIYEQDIFSQAEDMRRALQHYRSKEYPLALAEAATRPFKHIIFTGMGSSYFACYNAVTILRNKGIRCYAVTASQLLHYELDSIGADSLLVIVSQSGRSGEVADLVEKIKRRCYIVGLCNDPESPLGLGSNLMLNLQISPEEAVSTRTYLAPLMLLHILAKVFTGAWTEESYAPIGELIAVLEDTVNQFETLSMDLERFLEMPPYVVLIGRGYSLATVDSGALFTKEVAKYPSIPFDSGQFRHGPYEMLGENFSAFIFASRDQCYEMQFRLAKEIAGKGGRAVLVTDGTEKTQDNMLVINQRYPVPELAAMINIVPVQAFSNYIARKKGLKAGTFLYSSKITQVQ
ncbi:MAG: SIS domain-containing protein [Treponema sp.]|jgi:glucosamine--fructose-6-phosphate aminotransferase (isomerizing)|nr:SIS domain-containing protein [Treponema sp.]